IAKPIIAEQTPKYKIDSVEFEVLTLGVLPPILHLLTNLCYMLHIKLTVYSE
ncbi:hypothetical protein MKX03_037186, partial [Papaver bracteatum]